MLMMLLPLLLPLNGQVVINEFCASNSMMIQDPDFDNYADWIELFNAGSSDVDLGAYYLTDNYNSPTKWKFPENTILSAGDHILIWADGRDTNLHTNFRISAVGEELAIFATGFGLVDSVSFDVQMTDISYGRVNDGDPLWAWFQKATPGSANITTSYAGIIYSEPDFSERGGFYSAPLQVSLSSLFNGDIRYTTDGSKPSVSSPKFSGPISINETTVLRARMFRNHLIPGPTVTHTYFINENSVGGKLPVVSLASDPDHFWDSQTGIYVQDFKPDWEVPVNIEFYENDGSDRAAFNERAGTKVNGLWSWQLPQKMLGIYFKKGYGSGSLDYPLTRQRNRNSYKNFALRASGSDWAYTLFRDMLGQHSGLLNMDVEIMGFRPAIVYINGEYMGIHNIREKVDDDYIEKSYGLEPGSFDLVENQDFPEAGDLEAYNHLLTLLNKDLSNDDNYNAVAELVDIENYTDYQIIELASANTSISHNVMAWKPKVGGKWRWVVMDLDRGFFEPADHLIDKYINEDELLLEELIQNDSYKQYFAKRLASQLFTSYNPEWMNTLIDEHYSDIKDEVPQHVDRWKGRTSSYGNAIPSLEYWNNEVGNLRVFVTDRPAELMNDLQNYGFNEAASLGLASSPLAGGNILMNELTVPNARSVGHYIKGMELDLEAKPKPGYTFQGWVQSLENEIIPMESNWKYNDKGSNLGTSWRETGYNDDAWDSGMGQLGYGDNDENTKINYGSSNDRYITTYFRKAFQITSAQKQANQFILKMLRDDGAIVYLNGTEIIRSNMDCGNVDYNTKASNGITGASEDLYTSYKVDGSHIVTGENILAIEVHQISSSSSDLSFDLEFSAFVPQSSYYSTKKELSLAYTDDLFLTASYNKTSSCFIPEVISDDLTLDASCSPYLTSGDILITENATLTIDPGVEIWMNEGANIFVEGALMVNGSEAEEVFIGINPDADPGSWGVITFKNTPEPSILKYLILENASIGPDPIQDKAAISAFNADLVLDHITIEDVRGNPISARYSDIVLTNSSLHSEITGDLINVKYGHATIENCDFVGNDQPDTDAIDYDDIEDGIIRNCRISNLYGINSDAIDIGEKASNILIDSVYVHMITDKGVSIGQRSSATIQNSIFVSCNQAIALKDSCRAVIDRCLFYNNFQAVACFEKNPGRAGGNGNVMNSILSNSADKTYFADGASSLEISYCLSDVDTLPANANNIFGNPRFKDPTYFNFELAQSSPARMTGLEKGINVNMGAYAENLPFEPSVMIYQFFINAGNHELPEFIALYNPSSKKINVSGYQVTKGVQAILPAESYMDPYRKLYLTDDRTMDIWGAASSRKYNWDEGRLENFGENIILRDEHGTMIDHLVYRSDGLWPEEGFSFDGVFVLTDPTLDNHFAENWTWDTLEDVLPVEEKEESSSFSIYPNPTSGIIRMKGSDLTNASIQVYNFSGVLLKSEILPEGSSFTLDLSDCPNGLLILKIGSQAYKVIKQ